MFENVCKSFVRFKYQPFFFTNKCVALGNEILVIREYRSSVICYNVDKDEWTEKSCEVTKHLGGFSCAKLPLY